MNKPEQTPWSTYYLGGITDWLVGIKHEICGDWWCLYCNKYHNRRVTSFMISIKFDYVMACSLGRDAYDSGEWKIDHIEI